MSTDLETLIRPKQEQADLTSNMHKEIMEYFVDSTTGNLKSELINSVNCCACGSAENEFLFKKNGMSLVKCKNCGLFYVNPRPTEQSIINFFNESKSVDSYSDLVESRKQERKELIFKPIYNILKGHLPEEASVLEIGCGAGLLLETIKEQNSKWNVAGVEPNKRAVEICESKGIEVYHGGLETYACDKKYDAVVFWAVLDHFYDTSKIISIVHSLLKKDGIVLIGNINIDGFESKILGNENHAFAFPERMNFFGIKSITALLKNAGFNDITVKTTGKLDVDIISNYWTNGGQNGKNEFLEQIVFGSVDVRNNFQQFLIDNNLAGHMTVIGKK